MSIRFGNGQRCCRKPQDCTITDGCRLLKHPAKRANLNGDTTVRCPAKCVRPHPESGTAVEMQCTQSNRHAPPCTPAPPEAA